MSTTATSTNQQAKQHVILAILHGTSGLVSLACTTFVLQLQNMLASKPHQGSFHVHMYKDEAALHDDIVGLVSSPNNKFNIDPTVPLDTIRVCVIPGEFGFDAKAFLDAVTMPLQAHDVLALPYPLGTYDFKAALVGDDVKPERALKFNVPDANGKFPEEPRVFMCSVPTYVGPATIKTFRVFHPIRITHTSPLAFVGCVGNRLGGRLR
jgi:hypothetical protein